MDELTIVRDPEAPSVDVPVVRAAGRVMLAAALVALLGAGVAALFYFAV